MLKCGETQRLSGVLRSSIAADRGWLTDFRVKDGCDSPEFFNDQVEFHFLPRLPQR
jgi:hypothetical protein